MLALAERQPSLDPSAAAKAGAEQGLILAYIQGWRALLNALLFWTASPAGDLGRRAAERIDHRLIDLDASPETIAAWRTLLAGLKRDTPTSLSSHP